MIGDKYNFLTIIEVWRNKRKQLICKCLCCCGNESIVPFYKLKTNRIKSCGCKRNMLIAEAQKKHDFRYMKLYSKWCGIKRRCLNKNDSHYMNYGGRGIQICSDWKNDFETFKNWALENGYKSNLSIERIDIDKGYYPDNCMWIPLENQCINKTNTVYMKYNGEIKRMVDIAKIENIPYKTISSRYYRYKKNNLCDGVIDYEMILPNNHFKGISDKK